MTEYILAAIGTVVGSLISGWYFHTRSYDKGRLTGLLEGFGAQQHAPPVTPELSGGPREPA